MRTQLYEKSEDHKVGNKKPLMEYQQKRAKRTNTTQKN